MSFLTSLLDLLLPPRVSERLLRTLTLEDLEILADPATGVLPYHDPRVTALVWEVKYRANTQALALAGEFLAGHVLGIASEEIGQPLLIPIPMHPSRQKARGHNQTEILCEALLIHAKESVEYVPQALVRTVNTLPQQGLERRRRLQNVKNSMEVVRPELVGGRVCIVVDDVTTTGATLKEARRALRSAHARRVHSLTLAQS